MKRALVAIKKCNTYSSGEVMESLRKVCEAATLPSIEGKRVLLKPNILSDSPPERAVTTRAEVLRELIKLMWEKGASEVLVGDSPGTVGSNFTPRTSGITQVIEEEGQRGTISPKVPRPILSLGVMVSSSPWQLLLMRLISPSQWLKWRPSS